MKRAQSIPPTILKFQGLRHNAGPFFALLTAIFQKICRKLKRAVTFCFLFRYQGRNNKNNKTQSKGSEQ